MDYSGRLMCIIIVLCTLNALTVKQENNTDFTNEFVTKQNIEINGITMDGTHDKNGMTSGSTSNQQKLDMFTIAFTSHNKNPSSRTRNVLYFNATQIPLSDNNGFINLKSTLDSTKLSSNSPRRREMQSIKRLTVTDSLKIYSSDYQITQATVNRMHFSKGPRAVTTQEVVDSASRVPFSITSYDNSKHITSTHKFILDKNSPTKTTSSFRLKHDICHQYGGCKLVSGPYWYCQCDDSCEEYNDCCMDYTLNKKNNKQNYTCTSIEGSSLNLWGIQTISSCPQDHKNNSLNTQCSKGLMTKVGPPVLDINDKSRVYRNKYCAMCHGAAAVYLDIAFTLNPSLFRETDILLNMTDVEFKDHLFRVATYRLLIPREANVRYCLINLFRNDDALCNHYSNPILYKTTNRFYRNDFCRESTDNLSTICVYNIMDSLIADLMRSPILLKKLTILFSFDQNNALSTEDRCQQWSEKNDKECAHLAKYINAFFDCDYLIYLPQNMTAMDIMQSILLSLFVKELEGFITLGRPSQVLADDDLSLVNVKLECTIRKQVFGHEFNDIKQRIKHQRVVITEENNKELRWEVSNEPLEKSNVNISIKKQFRPTIEYLRDRMKYYLQNGIHLPDFNWAELCGDVGMVFKRFTNGSLHIISLACQSKPSERRHTSILAIVTLVFSGVSCVSLIVMIIYNRTQHLHHEIPFANLENLGLLIISSNIFLFIGQTAFYINRWLCYTISVLSHYSWLAVFSFTSLAVLYIVKTLMLLKGRRITTNESKTRKRRKITAIGMFVPLIFVVPAIIVDIYGPVYLSPGYMNEVICFPISYPGNLIFFTGPVLVMIVMNTACIFQIMVRIHMTKAAASNIRQSSTFSVAKIFIRILSISGCFWITGILAAYFKSEWLEYVFTMFCGLQGLFVAIANLTTRRMRCFRGKNEHTNET